jgi:hypothetical protein
VNQQCPADGRLEDHPLHKILAEIATRQVSGILTVSGDTDTVELYFVRGAVVFAESHYPRQDTRLGQLLVLRGFCTQEQVDQLLKDQSEKMIRLGRLAVETKLLKETDLIQVLEDQILLILFPCLTWNKGIYFFKQTDQVPYESTLFKPVNLKVIVRSGQKILSSWSWVKERVPNDDAVPKKVNGIEVVSEGVIVEHSDETGKIKVLTGVQEIIYQLIDGRRSIREICDTAHVFEWFSRVALLDLQDAGIVTIEDTGRKKIIKRKPDKEDGHDDTVRSLVPGLIKTTKISILFACFGLAAFCVVRRLYSPDDLFVRKDSPFAQVVTFNRAREIQAALIGYHLFEDHFPESLALLAEERWIDPLLLQDGWFQEIFYRKTSAGYELQSSGADGKMSSEDDMMFSGHVRDFLFGSYFSRLTGSAGSNGEE